MPSATSFTGRVVDRDTSAPLAGAVVYISHTLVPGAIAPAASPSDGQRVVTTNSGGFSITVPGTGNFYVEVFAPGMATLHDVVTAATTGVNQTRDLGVIAISADESNWLSLLNADRAKWGGAPLVFDETAEEVARLWVAFLGLGHYEHDCAAGDVACPSKNAAIAADHADFTSLGENIGAQKPPNTYMDQEAQFMAESANCPQPTDPSTCPFAENTGHFLNNVSKNTVWVGLAEDLNATSYDMADYGPTLSYFDMEFGYPNRSGATIQLNFRSVVRI